MQQRPAFTSPPQIPLQCFPHSGGLAKRITAPLSATGEAKEGGNVSN